MPRMTMAEFAQLAGVDTSTVSRALRGQTARVAPATMERIVRLAQEHGYHPDPVAASLRGGRSGVLGVLAPSLSDVAVASMLDGMAHEANQQGYLVALSPTGADRRRRAQAIDTYLERRVDGLVLADSTLRSPIPRSLIDSRVPFVLALRSSGKHLSVVADDELGGRLAAGHLLGLGHRDICVVAGPRTARTAARRLIGFIRELEAARVALPADRIAHSEFGVGQGHAAMTTLLTAGQRPTAVFALNDDNAIGASRALQDAGLLPGRDIALVGYNDISVSAQLQVPLTSVHNELEQIGRLSIRTLVAVLRGESPSSMVVPPRLVIRESSGYLQAGS